MARKANSRNSKARPGFTRKDWHKHVHPAFARFWSSQKKGRALGKLDDPEAADKAFGEWWKEFAAASRELDEAKPQIKGGPMFEKAQAAIFRRLDIEGSPFVPVLRPDEEMPTLPQNPESSALFRKILFLKYGVTFREMIHQVDIDKTPLAHRRLMAVHRDFWRFKSGVHFKDFKLKFSMDHFDLIVQGFDFGLDRLTAYEMAECLDEICPCSQKHSPEYLKKLRIRIKQACDRIV